MEQAAQVWWDNLEKCKFHSQENFHKMQIPVGQSVKGDMLLF